MSEPSPKQVSWSQSHSRHGHASSLYGNKGTPTYRSWQAMRIRCNHPERDPNAKYANRGISYDSAWDSFEQFLADMGERPAGTTLERNDNDAGYSATNCRWATPVDQARNRRNTRLTYSQAVEVAVRRLRGEQCKALAAEYGISESLPREIVKGRTWKDACAAAKEIVAND
jgi:hypothetical protein